MIGLSLVPLFSLYGTKLYMPDSNSIVSPGEALDNADDKSFVCIIFEFSIVNSNAKTKINTRFLNIFFILSILI